MNLTPTNWNQASCNFSAHAASADWLNAPSVGWRLITLPPDWEFSFAVGYTVWPHRTESSISSTRTREVPRNIGRFSKSDHTCTSQLYEVTMFCSRKNSHSLCSNSLILWGCENKRRIPISRSYTFCVVITELISFLILQGCCNQKLAQFSVTAHCLLPSVWTY